MINMSAHRFCVAPMLDLTTPTCRVLHRIFSRHAFLYSEMITTGALIYGDAERHLNHYQQEQPVALQLGGGHPDELARACEIALPYHYDEINLNIGCPSDRVQNNRIGACLMDSPHLVAECLNAMQDAAGEIPVTVKHRLGIDEQDERQVLDFVEILASRSRCRHFIIHARKAWLQGLNPQQNRDIPPLNYPLVYQIKQQFPELSIILNGGINNLAQCREHLQYLDGVMLGRAAYQNPEILLSADSLFGSMPRSIEEVLPELRCFMEAEIARGIPLSQFTRHLLGLFRGQKGAKQYRRMLSEQARLPNAGIEIWDKALAGLQFP